MRDSTLELSTANERDLLTSTIECYYNVCCFPRRNMGGILQNHSQISDGNGPNSPPGGHILI